MAKQYTYHVTKDGDQWLCSGYGVYPNGEKCKGCSDCKGKFLKRKATKEEISEVFNKNHLMVTIKPRKAVERNKSRRVSFLNR